MLDVIQVALNTTDMAGSLQLYSKVFGFTNGGGQGLWGPPILVQGLPVDSRATMWWLVGHRPWFQFEFFQHTRPAQRPLRADWSGADLGWVRCGIAVADFDASLSALSQCGVNLCGAVVVARGLRRAALRDPYAGQIIEIFEDGPGLPWQSGATRPGAALVYATSSVSDLSAARHYYEQVIGLDIGPLEQLHGPEHEAMWGLAGAARTGFIARAGGVGIEVIEYQTPRGRPRTAAR